jgi:hypothetical protein
MRTPGAISEISPDEGCFVQAWSGFSVAWPIVRHVFGVMPEAHRKNLVLRPAFPESWLRASLRNLRIGNETFDFHWDGETLLVVAADAEWSVSSQTVPIRLETAAERSPRVKDEPGSTTQSIG